MKISEDITKTGHVLAIDPGGTNGFSSSIYTNAWQIKFDSMLEAYEKIKELVDEHDIIVAEKFNATSRYADMSAVGFLAIIELICEMLDKKLVLQTNSEGKGFWKDDLIKRYGLWEPGKRHAMDALKHRLHWEMKQGRVDLTLLKV